jgi:hypothetical protein
VWQASKSSGVNATLSISHLSNPYINTYWRPTVGTYTDQEWWYVEMTCQLPANASIGTYTVLESGSDIGYRIYPASNCSPHALNTVYFFLMILRWGNE